MSSRDPDHLSSVQDNPFMKGQGLGSRGYARRADPVSAAAKTSNGNNTDMDEPEEYHVNSGFVNKLRSKFAKLENNQNKFTLSKKSASVENLLSIGNSKDSNEVSRYRNRFGSAGRSSTDDSSISTASNVELRKKVPIESKGQILTRPSSTEMTFKERPPLLRKQPDVSRSTDFTRPNVDRKSRKPPMPARKTSSDTQLKRNSSSDLIPKIEHHDWKIAPDLELIGRDNLVIIESSVPKKTEEEPKRQQLAQDSEDDYRRAKPMKVKSKDENELPKPNTVSAFRSMFEKVNKTSDVVQGWRHLSPPRKSSSSDKESPKVMSPVASPRTPLSRKNDDNVFEESVTTVPEKNIVSDSPRNSFNDNVPEVDTTPVSRKKSMEVFQREHETRPSGVTSSNNQHTMTPQHPISNVFDSSAIKPDTQKSKKPKPKLHLDTKPHVPKDTLQMKHDGTLKTYSGEMSPRAQAIKSPEIIDMKASGFDSPREQTSSPVGRNSGGVSPRQTNIFDSSKIVKKERPPPPIPSSPAEANTSKTVKKVEIRIKDADKEVAMDVSPTIPSKFENNEPVSTKSSSGLTEIKTTVIPVKRNKGDKKKDNDIKPPNTYSREMNATKPLTFERMDETEKKPSRDMTTTSNGEAPISGMSSFLANRLNKSKTEQENQPTKNKAVHLANGSSPSPVPRKRQAPERPVVNGDVEMVDKTASAPPLPKTPELDLPKTNLDDIIGRKKSKKPQSATKMVFDSSNIATKRKDPPKRKPPRQTLDQMNVALKSESAITPVPKLDLSSLTGVNSNVTEYQEGYIPTVIKPCTIKFVGAEVTFDKTPYKKTRTSKAKISFAENETTTFEYDDEESALAQYLRDHPEEEEEARQQQEEVERAEQDTSADDLLTDSPRNQEADPSAMKSNTVIGMPTGALSSYKSKIQVPDFQFGMSTEPEDYYTRQAEPEPESEEGRDLLPADDSQLDTFSSEVSKADMLF